MIKECLMFLIAFRAESMVGDLVGNWCNGRNILTSYGLEVVFHVRAAVEEGDLEFFTLE